MPRPALTLSGSTRGRSGTPWGMISTLARIGGVAVDQDRGRGPGHHDHRCGRIKDTLHDATLPDRWMTQHRMQRRHRRRGERGQEIEDALAVVGSPDAVLVLYGDRANAAVAE